MTTMTLPSVRGLVKTSAARAVSWSRADRLIGAVTGLARKGIPAAVFVITEMVGTLRPPRCDRLYVLVARAFSRRPSARARLAGLIEKLELHAADGRRFALPETALATTVHLLRTFP